MVGIPNILAGGYLLFLAAPVYVSQAQLVVYQESSGHQQTLSLGKKRGGTSLEGDYLLSSYLHSMKAFSALDHKILAREWSSGFGVQDYGGLFQGFQRTPLTLWHYYRDSVLIHIDPNSAILTLSVLGYHPGFTQALSQKLLSMGEQNLSQLGEQAYRSAFAYDKGLVQKQQKRLEQAIAYLADYQKKIGILSLGDDYRSALDTRTQLLVKQAEIKAQLAVYAKSEPKNPVTDGLREEVAQIDADLAKNSAAQARRPLVQYGHRYTLLKTKVANAEHLLLADDETLLRTRQNQLSHQYVLSYISPPYRPAVPQLPYRVTTLLWILLGTLIVYLVVK